MVPNFQLDLHNCVKGSFAASESPTTTHRGHFGGSVHAAVTNIADCMEISLRLMKVFVVHMLTVIRFHSRY